MNPITLTRVLLADARRLAGDLEPEERAALRVACPTCCVGAGEMCRTRDTGRIMPRPHRMRVRRGEVVAKLDGRKATHA